MSIIPELPHPLDSIVIENPRGTYKDFQLKDGDTYPLPGITYPVDYGYLPKHTGEDGHELDFLVGSDTEGYNGYILVWRNDVPKEHKFFTGLSQDELDQTFDVFEPITIRSFTVGSLRRLVSTLEKFKD